MMSQQVHGKEELFPKTQNKQKTFSRQLLCRSGKGGDRYIEKEGPFEKELCVVVGVYVCVRVRV